MQIQGSLPINIARAYGITPSKGVSPPKGVAPTTSTTPAAPVGRIQPTDAYSPVNAAQPNARIDELVAGRVNQPINFTPSPAPQSATLQLYTRAADRIEAATSIQIGKSLDVSG